MMLANNLTNVSVGLSVVLLVALVSLLMLKRARGMMGINNRNMSLLNTIPIGQREKIVLMSVEGKKILIGITQHNINTLYVSNKDKETSVDKAERTEPFVTKLRQEKKEVTYE